MVENLRYLGSTYTKGETTLLYAVFDYQGRELKWFPKWKDIIDIMRNAYITEECCHNGKASPELLTCLLDLIPPP